MLQNEYPILSCKIVADTAENEQHFSCKIRQHLLIQSNFAKSSCGERRCWWRCAGGGGFRPSPSRASAEVRRRRRRRAFRASLSKIGKICNFFSKICKFLAGSFSAVSKRNFARKYAFDSIFQALQDLHPFAPLQSQNFRKNRFEKSAIFVKN